MILPFIEQADVYAKLNPQTVWGQPNRDTIDTAWADSTRKPLIQTAIGTYRCPSDPAGQINDLVQNDRYGRSNYVISFHDVNYCCETMPALQANGIAFIGSRVKIKDITDGTASTLAVGERVHRINGGGKSANPATPWVLVAPYHPASANWAGASEGNYAYTSTGNPRGFVSLTATPSAGFNDFSTVSCRQGYSSNHPGGALFVFSDGAVKLLDQTIDATTFQRLANRRDGRVIGSY